MSVQMREDTHIRMCVSFFCLHIDRERCFFHTFLIHGDDEGKRDKN